MKKYLSTVLIYTPFFWLFELIQNIGYKVCIGAYGWVYPIGEYHWFSFRTFPSWAIAIVVMLLVADWLRPKNYSLSTICLVAGTICWVLEWCNGFLWAELLQQPLYIWSFSPLRYVGIEAIVLWWLDVWVLFKLIDSQKI